MTITVFSTRWCGSCLRLKARLEGAGIAFSEVDLDDEPEHGRRIEAVTGGNRIVPSVDVGGRLLVNPTLGAIQTVAAALGGGTLAVS